VQQFDLEFHHGTKYCDKHRGLGSKFSSGSGNDHMGGTYKAPQQHNSPLGSRDKIEEKEDLI
jgi:hypothetical protein